MARRFRALALFGGLKQHRCLKPSVAPVPRDLMPLRKMFRIITILCEVKAWLSWVWGWPGLHNEFKATLTDTHTYTHCGRYNCIFLILLLFYERVSSILGLPQSKLIIRQGLPASTFWVVKLKVCITTIGFSQALVSYSIASGQQDLLLNRERHFATPVSHPEHTDIHTHTCIHTHTHRLNVRHADSKFL